MDTNYQQGTVSLDLVANTYEYYVGNRVGSGSLAGTGEGTVEVEAVSGASEITLWNSMYGSGPGTGPGGGQINNLVSGDGEQREMWTRLIPKVIKFCKAQNDAAAILVAAAISSCRAAGGQHSGGKLGICGIGTDTGTCTRRMR